MVGPFFTRIWFGQKTAQQAMLWFKDTIKRISGSLVGAEITREDFKTQEELVIRSVGSKLLTPVSDNDIGRMFLFKYDAKYKNRLPYWDEYPLVFPIDNVQNGFLGINLHYLPFAFRMPILNHLGAMSNDNDKYDDQGRVDVSYKILKSYSLMFDRFYKDCIKRYRYDCVRSQFYYVSPAEWQNVAALPFERWVYKK